MMACRGIQERCSTDSKFLEQISFNSGSIEWRVFMLMRVTACYRTKPINVMAVKKCKINSAL